MTHGHDHNSKLSGVALTEVLKEELEEISVSRRARFPSHPPATAPGNNLIGLAFSGGGIRSATFNLGVLQALAKEQLLHCFDYLSSVSGGGYIASWLMGWMHHQQLGVGEIEKRLTPHPADSATTAEAPEVRFLRAYSNYLTPKKGVLKADFWTFIASYLRNMLLNLIILVSFFLSLLLLPRAIVYLPHWLDISAPSSSQYLSLGLGIICGLTGVIFMGLNLCWIEVATDRKPSWIAKPASIHLFIVIPLFLAAMLTGYGLDQIFRFDLDADAVLGWSIFVGLFIYVSVWAATCFVRWVARRFFWRGCPSGPPSWIILLSALAAGAISGLLFLPYARIVNGRALAAPDPLRELWRLLTFGTPTFTGIILLAGALHIGLMGRQFADAYREWWARLGGWLMIYSGSWLVLFVTALYVPRAIGYAYHHPYHHVTISSAVLWVASTLYGVLFGKNSTTSSPQPDTPTRKKLLGWAARATPYIFVAGLLALLSILAGWIPAVVTHQEFDLSKPAQYLEGPLSLVLWLGFLAVAMFFSWRVDINAFSTHMLYRNRLVRCYLGASVPKRHSQPFSGFSPDDDLPLAALKIPKGAEPAPVHGRPLPLLNASLDVTRGQELALQTRKARSFVFSPAYSGYARALPQGLEWQSAYAETALADSKKPDAKTGISLGTSVAISGAAASPNMGSYSDAALAFLMTIFDVRLGWWLGNPRKQRNWKRGSPRVAFISLLKELFGAVDDESNYIYVSDGGHFENLAIYELVRRQCKLIVACDASCDRVCGCADLNNALEHCRVDFGVEIEIDIQALAPGGPNPAEHFAVGKIRYAPGDSKHDGTLIYIKPVLRHGGTNPDPSDLLAYAVTNTDFPHDSTANQWFDENRFENYRHLGYVSGLAAAQEIRQAAARVLNSTVELMQNG